MSDRALVVGVTGMGGDDVAHGLLDPTKPAGRSFFPALRSSESLGVEPAPYPGPPTPLEEQMADSGPAWQEIVERLGLKPYRIDELASWWHSDLDLMRPLETFADMTKSRDLGCSEYQDSAASFTDLFARLRAEQIIPA